MGAVRADLILVKKEEEETGDPFAFDALSLHIKME